MYTFSILLLPLALSLYCAHSKRKSDALIIITGLLTGFFVLACKEFFTFSHRIVLYSFGRNFAYLFFREALIPLAVLYAAFFFLSKDTKEFRIKAFFPLLASFYTVYLPYLVITGPEARVFFTLFVKPWAFTAMLLSLGTGLEAAVLNQSGKIMYRILGIAVCVLGIVLPSLTETFFLMGYPVIIRIVLVLLMTVLPAVHFLPELFSKKNA